ncbi:methionine aminotransferase [Neptuniibacter caesariensis]|uniref:Putative aminotransferase n=1 Tax=Neptuniibacter caesariensis TaxID=207954 RepID=A0A7U8GTY2_NEPCE|nr:methionine aminotransferase [Neptuniibacter caesariensis]EAR62818.1 putative aminotransferase [Oceanospirillum sp. MED92] [Neptuniibacter caesariensis]
MDYPSSKLPSVGLTIFSQMTALANQQKAINLSQGFPDFDGPKPLLDAVGRFIAEGKNQYAPMAGLPELCQAVSDKVFRCYGRKLEAESEVTITSGATEAIFAAISATVNAGDEVIVFDPAYDSYEPAVTLNGGTTVHIPLLPPQFAIDFQRLQDAITLRTRMIIFNSPHNPTGSVMSSEDLLQLEQLLEGTNILLLSDEVYEHIIFDNQVHQSFNRSPMLAERSFIVSSFGKTYHVTGWKVGYCVAPEALMKEFRKVHQYLTFSTSTPMQAAIAEYMQSDAEHDQNLPVFYQQKRDLMNERLSSSRFGIMPSPGTYFQLLDYTAISDLSDQEFVLWLLKEAGVATIPLSPFYKDGTQTGMVRLCFAKSSDTLEKAAEQLCRI